MECKITVNREKKLVRITWGGKSDAKGIEELYGEVSNEINKFPKGEVLVLNDTSNLDTKIMTPGVADALEKGNAKVIPLCRKWATVVPSFMLQKSFEHDITHHSNVRRFVTEQEAMKWLLEN